MDFVQGLDPGRLVLAETVIAFLLSPFASPPYNLATLLFGIYAQENTESVRPLQIFTALLGGSALFDIVWMIKNEQNGFLRFCTIVLLVLKVPTFFSFALSLRQRGAQFGGLGIRGNDLSGATVWAMPGGFTSNGYQPVEEERTPGLTRPNIPAQQHQHQHQTTPKAADPRTAAPGAYQTV